MTVASVVVMRRQNAVDENEANTVTAEMQMVCPWLHCCCWLLKSALKETCF